MVKLFEKCLEEKNSRRIGDKIVIKSRVELKHWIREHMKMVVKTVIKNPVAYDFNTDKVSHMQVLQEVSKKGIEWDKKYDSWDWRIVWAHQYPAAEVVVDEKWKRALMREVDKGKRYMTSISSLSANMKKVYAGL